MFGAGFKREVVLELLSGAISAASPCRRYEPSATSPTVWRKQFEGGRSEESDREESEAPKAHDRDLERLVRQLTLETGLLGKKAVRAMQQRNGSPSTVSGAPSASGKRAR